MAKGGRSRSRLVGLVRELGYEVSTANSADEGRATLVRDKVDVVLADLQLWQQDPGDLVRVASQLRPPAASILVASNPSAEQYKTAIQRGAVDLLDTQVGKDELGGSLRKALDASAAGFHGSLHGIDLLDVLQLFNHSRRSVVVNVGTFARVHLRNGEIIHATFSPDVGRAALRRLLMTRGGAVETGPPEECPQTIDEPFDGLLLDVMREIDELRARRRRGGTTGPMVPLSGQPVLAAPPAAEPRKRYGLLLAVGLAGLATAVLFVLVAGGGTHPKPAMDASMPLEREPASDQGLVADGVTSDAASRVIATSKDSSAARRDAAPPPAVGRKKPTARKPTKPASPPSAAPVPVKRPQAARKRGLPAEVKAAYQAKRYLRVFYMVEVRLKQEPKNRDLQAMRGQAACWLGKKAAVADALRRLRGSRRRRVLRACKKAAANR